MNASNKIVTQSIRTLHDLSKAINSTLDISRVEAMLLRKTSQLMGSPKVLILLLDEQKQSLTVHNHIGFDPERLLLKKIDNVQPFDHCIVQKGRVITLEELITKPDKQLLQRDCPQLLEMFFAPLEVQGETYGLLGVVGRGENFSQIELEIFCSIGSQAAVAMENASLHARLHSTFLHTAEALAEAINSRDPYTGGHTRRVQNYSLLLADSLDLTAEEKETLRLAAILHDIGKIGIDDNILKKGEKLTAQERRIMNKHPRIGANILQYVDEMQEVVPGVLHHHEWFDGSGYPDGLVGEQIPLQARIIAIADAFDALTTDRPYRKASHTAEAISVLELDAGNHFDPALLSIFRSLQTNLVP